MYLATEIYETTLVGLWIYNFSLKVQIVLQTKKKKVKIPGNAIQTKFPNPIHFLFHKKEKTQPNPNTQKKKKKRHTHTRIEIHENK